MKAYWKKLAATYDAYSQRERWMIAAAVLGGIVLIGAMLFLDPAMKRSRLADQTLADQRMELTNLQAQIAALQSPAQDPDVAARSELAEVKRRLAELGSRFADIEATLVPPQRMPGLLEDLIGRSGGLRLLSLRTLPVAPVLDRKAGDKTAEDKKVADVSVGLFKHGVEIKLEGSYQELASYLARLEKSPAKLLWSGVALSADKHPKLVLTLTVFTLSLDRTWLIV
jgi:MSHA biogenesis protein MshJ